jgi:hypothetical protein
MKMTMVRKVALLAVCMTAGLLSFGCATTYEFVSSPENAAVYQNLNGERALLGQTPLVFNKSGLPSDRPFTVTFVRDGWEPLDVLISPTGESRTKVTATLKPGRGDGKDPQTLRTRKVLASVFKIQELMFQNKTVDALSHLRDLEKDEPNLPEVFVLKGSLYAAINDREQARAAWQQALALDPTLDRIRIELKRLEDAASAEVTR